MLKRYFLKIPFELNGNSSIKSENDNINFKLDGYEIKICLNKNHQKGDFIISYFDDETEIWPFYLIFKKTIDVLNLSSDLWSIKIATLNKDTIMGYVDEDYYPDDLVGDDVFLCKSSGKYVMKGSFKMGLIQLNPIDDIIEKISKNFKKFKKMNLQENKKLAVVLDIYTNSYFQDDTARFLSYSIILELLKPKVERKGKGLECVNELKSTVEKYVNSDDVKNDDDLLNEFNGLNKSIGDLNKMSITYSIKQISNFYDIELDGYDDLPKMLGKCYNVRSKFAHSGSIHKDFDECFVFLREFIPILIIKVMDYALND